MSISSHVFRLRHANTSPFRSHPIFFFELCTKQIMTPMFFPGHAVISIYYNNAKLYCSKDRRSEVCGEERNNIRFVSYMTVDGYVEAEAGEKREKMNLRGPHQHESLSR